MSFKIDNIGERGGSLEHQGVSERVGALERGGLENTQAFENVIYRERGNGGIRAMSQYFFLFPRKLLLRLENSYYAFFKIFFSISSEIPIKGICSERRVILCVSINI